MNTQRPGGSLSNVVLAAVAEAQGVNETLTPPLYEAVNPEGLDTLFRESGGTVGFQYHGYAVTVDHEGDVSLEKDSNVRQVATPDHLLGMSTEPDSQLIGSGPRRLRRRRIRQAVGQSVNPLPDCPVRALHAEEF